MRWLHLAIICLLAVVTLVFAAENMEIVSVDFLWFGVRLPLAFLVVTVYIVGMATGGSVWALIRRSVKGARRSD
jgi:lipopolysaccharide assembly protein A